MSTPNLTEPQARTIAAMGFDPDDNTAFVGWMQDAKRSHEINDDEVIDWFLGEGWPWPDSPITDDDRDALRAYIA